jgi:hypothetical protein
MFGNMIDQASVYFAGGAIISVRSTSPGKVTGVLIREQWTRATASPGSFDPKLRLDSTSGMTEIPA